MPKESWFRATWTPPLVLLAIFLVALYLRAYFPWELAAPAGLLSGGSDSFYYERIIRHIAETGGQLVFDPRLNFPIGLTNPRPPLYAWTTLVAGRAFAPLVGDLAESVKVAFLMSTALWGALTIFPTYFLTKEAFGRRAAILAAFFLAVLPAHLQRSPATNGDHDAMVLFFVVTGFFFFLKSLKSLHEKRWVDDWAFWTRDGRTSIRAGLKVFFAENRTSVLYAMLAGWSLATIALIWQGWAYAPVILLVYFLVQMLVHRFRNQDPMGVLIAFGIALALPLLVAFPWYWSMGQIAVWYDVPLYLYLAAIGLGIVFTATRDYPWALVLPVVVGASGASLLVLSFFFPAVGAAFVSGAGYFVRTKAFETIAEAQPPGLSQIILSFGVATYFLSLFGLLWMVRQIPKRPSPDYLFVVVWAVAAIFMAQAAARFIFNASAAIAMVSAWITVVLLDLMRFDDMRKTFRSLAAGGRLSALRRSIKPRHVVGSLLVVVILLLPNVWFGVDASIPFERKSEFDEQVYTAYPEFLRPEGYRPRPGDSFFFGAFGYSLPLERRYFPSAWSWFRQQDADVHPVEKRPAFLSWWDYGFEAVDVGAHPTVADNFLDGYHLAGNFITAQSEAEAIALLNLRLLEGDFWRHGRRFGGEVRSTLEARDLPWASIEDAFRRPDAYVSVVTAAPLTYGVFQTLQPHNARYIYGEEILVSRLDRDELASLNHALREITGASIRYFAVDTRLFPFDGEQTGIFYAPSKLSDHRILELPDGRSLPRDFFDVIAATQRGNINLEEVRPADQVSDLTLRYKERFYDSMFYRAYVGFPPQVAGYSCSDCIPGFGSVTDPGIVNVGPMQAWNLSHFKLVYKTAYYNPFPQQEIANHTDAWEAIDFFTARELQGEINRGEATGVVDLSTSSLIRNGIVVVKYYDGAFVNGTVTLGGTPFPGVRVTVHDELGIPHDMTVTGADGRYSILAPFGDVRVIASVGAMDNRTMVGNATLRTVDLQVSDAAAMREDVDADADGVVDWLITRNIVLPDAILEGVLYVDVDGDGTLGAEEPRLADADLTLRQEEFSLTRTARAGPDGRVRLEGLFPGTYEPTIEWEGRAMTVANVTVVAERGPLDIAVNGATLRGFVFDVRGKEVGGAELLVTDATNGTRFRATSAEDGSFAFPGLLPGPFEAVATQGIQSSLPSRATVAGDGITFHNVTVHPSAGVTGRTMLRGSPTGFVTFTLVQKSAARLVRVVTSDAAGRFSTPVPEGTWDVHARHHADTALWAVVGALTVEAGEAVTFDVDLAPGAVVRGFVYDAQNRSRVQDRADVVFRGPGGQHRVRTDPSGRLITHLPLGTWTVQITHNNFSFLAPRTVTGPAEFEFPLPPGVPLRGTVVRDFPRDAEGIEEPVPDAALRFSDGTRTFETLTAGDGSYATALPGEGRFSLRITRRGFLPLERLPATASEWQASPDFALAAQNVTVSGTLRLDGDAVPDVPVAFLSDGPGAAELRVAADEVGRFAASLAPGPYRVEVDVDLSGKGDVRLQLRRPTEFNVTLGASPITFDLDLAVRARVEGTVDLMGQPESPPVRFDGPDATEANVTDGAFTVLLARGAYSVLANLVRGRDTFLALQTLNVTEPTSVSVVLRRATNVTGTVRHGGNPVPDVSVTFAGEGGVAVGTASDLDGRYNVFLLGGTYGVSVDQPATETEGDGVRHIRYTFSASLSVVQDTRNQAFHIDLDRTLDNTTVSGTVRIRGSPVSARLAFVARDANGLNTSATAGADGRYAVAMQPGAYDVYTLASLERAASLGTLDVEVGSGATFDVSLEDAVRVSGVTTVRGGVRTTADVSFASPAGRVYDKSDASGSYEVFLPANSYAVEASAAGTERGVTVAYRTTTVVEVSGATVVNLELAKVVRRVVEVTWDAAQRSKARAGDSVDYTVTIGNMGNEDDTIALSATGAGFTFRFSDDRVSLPFGAMGNTAVVGVTIMAAQDARVEHAPIRVTARSESDDSATGSVVLDLDIERFRGLEADVSSDAPTWDGRFLNYTLEVRNSGNGEETFRLSLPNLDELTAAGWRAALVGPSGEAEATLSLTVGANATERPVLRLESVGGLAGTLARVHVGNADDPRFEALVTVNIQMPALAVEGPIRATGTGISLQEPALDLATIAFLISLAAVVAAVAYLAILRRRAR